MAAARLPLFPFVFVVALGACGGAALESGVEATSAPAREPLPELEALQRDFDTSEAQLGAQLGPSPVSSKKDEAAPKPTDDAPPANVGSACDGACRALGSMRRSADGICSLTAELHERCRGARGRVELAAQKVAAAGCLCRP